MIENSAQEGISSYESSPYIVNNIIISFQLILRINILLTDI